MDDFLFEYNNDIKENFCLNIEEIEKRYEMENAFLKTLSLGNYEATIKNLEFFFTLKTKPRTEKKVDNSRYFMSVLNTLCRKYLELVNNIHPLYLDAVSTKISISLQKFEDADKIDMFYTQIIKMYCQLVQYHSRRGYCDLIKNVIAYIDFHYFEELNLSFLSSYFNISCSYLSALFKKEVGKTLTQYIQDVRMRHAVFLLNSTSLNISEIAQSLGYLDDNYFIRLFKRKYKITPKSYRNTNKKDINSIR